MIRFSCPSCSTAVSAPRDCAGRSTRCHKCGGPITVPLIGRLVTAAPVGLKASPRPPRSQRRLQSPAEPCGPRQQPGKPRGWSVMTRIGVLAGVALLVFAAGGVCGLGLDRRITAGEVGGEANGAYAGPAAETRRGLPGRGPEARPPGTEPGKQDKPAQPRGEVPDFEVQLSSLREDVPPPPAPPPAPAFVKLEPPSSPRKESAPPPGKVEPPPKAEDTPPARKEDSPSPRKAEPPSPKGEEPPQPPKKEKKDEDLPEVSLQVPEETRPEVKAPIRANTNEVLSAKKAADRVKAAQVLGELGEQGKPARGVLCRAMLDPSADVRVAAADALKSIDPRIQFLAVALATTE